MRLSLRGEYALRALLVLGLRVDEPLVRIQSISDDQNIPKRFLEQILNDLKAGGFVESKRGIAGGYRLARSPENISLATVIRHIEGTLTPLAEAHENTDRPQQAQVDEAQLAIRSVLKEVLEAMVKVLEQLTVADLCQRARELRNDSAEAGDFMI